MFWDEQRVLANIRAADTDDLLDRVTAYRVGMEPEAIAMIENELHRRGVTKAAIAEREETCRRECIVLPNGLAVKCSFCSRPAVAEGWGWHKLWQRIPLFPRRFRYCKDDVPKTALKP